MLLRVFVLAFLVIGVVPDLVRFHRSRQRKKHYREERERLDRMLAEMEASTPDGVYSWITYSGMLNELSSAPPPPDFIEERE